MSTKELPKDQELLLRKGLKFTPVPKLNLNELQADVDNFCRKLRLHEYFFDDLGDQTNLTIEGSKSIVKNKGNFHAPPGRDTNLDNYINYIQRYPLHENIQQKKSNIKPTEKLALENLSKDQTLVIKEADKGGGTIIMDKDYYGHAISTMLQDQSTYKQAADDIDEQIFKELNQLIQQQGKCLTKDEANFITNFEPSTSNFYGLPKIHKSKYIQNAIKEQQSEYIQIERPKDLPFRPIVAGPNCPTSRLSNLLDIILKPLTKNVKSYIKDSSDFLMKLPQETNSDTILATFDVVSLYTNIPNDLGIKAINYWIEQFPSVLDNRFTKEFILTSTKFVLNKNTFQFNNRNYIQISGTAMGTKMAPTYATLTMGFLEEQILYPKLLDKYGEDISKEIISCWLRFLDDCFILWNPNYGNIADFYDLLQNLHEQIKFTMDINPKQLPFLDILVYKQGTKLETDIYHKETDTFQYLHYTSCHPKHTKNNIPFSLARRLCNIVSNKERRDMRLKELEGRLLSRKYPEKLIKSGIERAKKLDSNELRNPTSKNSDQSSIAFVHTYNPKQPNIYKLIKSGKEMLNNSERMKEAVANTRFLNSTRQPPNLKRILTRAKFSTEEEIIGAFRCGRPRCKTCPHIREASTISFNNTTQEFRIKAKMTCLSKNLLYCIICRGCNKEYIGQTGDCLRNRVTVHRQQINHPELRQIELSGHLADCAKNQTTQFDIIPFYKIREDNESLRKTMEHYFIKKFKPELNKIR